MTNIIEIDPMEMANLIAETNAMTNKVLEKNPIDVNIAREVLGFPGAMISASKSGYGQKHPKNVAVFNSNVVTAKGKIWYGDLDVTLSEQKLADLAKKIGETVYVLREMDGRFETEGKPRIENAVYAVSPEGKNSYQARIKRETTGKLKGKLAYDFE